MLDLHTHVVPASTPFISRLTSADPRWARLERGGTDSGDVMVSGHVFRTVRRIAWDLNARRDAAQAAGVTGQLLSAMPELLAPWASAQDAAGYAAAFNDWLASEVRTHQGFYHGLGIVPLSDPDTATAMLGGIAESGLVGVELPSQPPGVPLHSLQWSNFLDEAQRLGLLVFVHAVAAGHELATYPHPMAANGVLFPAGIGTALGGLIATGALASRPTLRILASHGGGSLMTEIPRIDFLRKTNPVLREIMPESAADTARRLWFDPMLFDADLVHQLARIAGPDRIVYGTDHPFMPDPLSFLDGPEFDPGFAATVRETNPAALLALLTTPIS